MITIPNILTILRLLLMVPVVWLAYQATAVAKLWAFIVFLIAMLTDVIDGEIAKRFNQISKLGTFLDPVVDKIVLVGMFFVLADLGLLPIWMALLMLAREFLVDGIRSAAAAEGKVVGANFMGKTKATLQTVTISLGLGLPVLAVDPALVRNIVTIFTGITLAIAWGFAFVFCWWNRWLLAAGAKAEAAKDCSG